MPRMMHYRNMHWKILFSTFIFLSSTLQFRLIEILLLFDRMAQSIKVMFAIAIFITYALQAYVPVEIAWSTYIDHRVKENKVFWEYVIRTIVTLATCEYICMNTRF